jgi:hypothetical protein
MINPKEIIVSPPATPAETVSQELVVVAEGYDTEPRGLLAVKRAALRRLIEIENVDNALIFCNRKREAGILQRSLARHGFDAAMLHGDMVQSARTEVLARFKRGEIPFLVCSDVAARGARHRWRQSRFQLRCSRDCRGLHPPYWAHRPCRPRGTGFDGCTAGGWAVRHGD